MHSLRNLAIRAGWVVETSNENEITFVNWNKEEERGKKSQEVHRSSMPNNATAHTGQKCQTSFVYRHDNCYIA
ncbi:unnamed protein product, partial [Onchocerca flexuosa]|uniref:Type II toxin-antitoxin system HicA family toxin n=1 Tax=Onchocerca flexuosa TaxID=387005 RepID=A0A183HRL8_9BILA